MSEVKSIKHVTREKVFILVLTLFRKKIAYFPFFKFSEMLIKPQDKITIWLFNLKKLYNYKRALSAIIITLIDKD